MMGGVSPETCWAIKKHRNNKFYYTVASCWLFLWDLKVNIVFLRLYVITIKAIGLWSPIIAKGTTEIMSYCCMSAPTAMLQLWMPSSVYSVAQSTGKKVNVKTNPITGLDRPLGFQETEAPRIYRQLTQESGKVFNPTHRPPSPPRIYNTTGPHFC